MTDIHWIEFTQYLRPNGERRQIRIHRPPTIVEKAQKIIEAGFRFEAEVLTDGLVSLTITGKNTDVAITIGSNDAWVLSAVDKMVLDFDVEGGLKEDVDAGSA